MKKAQNKWLALFTSNFLGVFNDNFLKNSIIFVSIAWSLPAWLSQSQLISIVASCLVLPYLFLSPLGGRLAVRHSKLKVFRVMKLLEILIIALTCIAFYKQWVIMAVIFGFALGALSCLYSPSKYSLIRDIGGEEGISFGSGMFETMSFMGILLGTFFASLVSDHYSISLFSIIILGVGVLGYLAVKSIRAVELPVDDSDSTTLNPISFLKDNYQFARKYRLLNSAVFGSSSFWLIANMVQMDVIIHCKNVYNTSNSVTGIVMGAAAIGIALGTATTGKMMGEKVNRGIIIPAMTGIIISLFVIALIPLPFGLFVTFVVLFALAAGIFQVPCMAMVQQANLGRKRGDTIAYLNMVNFIFILIGTALFSLTTLFTNENSFIVFGVMTGVCVLILLYFLFKYPEFRRDTKKMFVKKLV